LKQYFLLINSGQLHASLPHSLLFRLFNGQKIEAKKHNILYIRTKTRFLYTATISQ
jgi:hypothetical protein